MCADCHYAWSNVIPSAPHAIPSTPIVMPSTPCLSEHPMSFREHHVILSGAKNLDVLNCDANDGNDGL